MTRRPTLEQVALRSGVSRATASRVVRHEPSVDPHLAGLVNRAIEDLGYVPNAAARSLMTRRSGVVALIAAESDKRVFGDPFFASIVRGVSHHLNSTGVQLSLSMAQNAQDLHRLRGYLAAGSVDGAMVISEHQDLDVLGTLGAADLPLVFGGRPIDEGSTVTYVDHENRRGGSLAARRLVNQGRTRIATIAGPQDMSAGVDRLVGFREVLSDNGHDVHVETADFTTAGARVAARDLLRRHPDIDGLFVASDLMALGALEELRHSGRTVPDDVALIGFDDSDVASAVVPALTTIRQRTNLQGRLLARLLLEQLGHAHGTGWPEGLRRLESGSLILDVELVARQSG
ncbi:MAG: LacI family DNA-binding transcriptional regulator [Ornithinimicrobium sp.]